MTAPINLETEPTGTYEPDPPHQRMARWTGDWKGTAKTWLDPAGPPVEAPWEGRIAAILGGRFVRFTYRSRINGKPHAGELLFAWESGEKLWRTSWVDSFHTGSAILMSVGEKEIADLDVRGSYFAAPGHPHWGWRTTLEDSADGALTLRMYNVDPGGKEDLGVEVALRRQPEST